MKKQRFLSTLLSLLMLVSLLLSSCNFPIHLLTTNSSFDEAILLMLASRGVLGLYGPAGENASLADPSSLKTAALAFESTLDQLNQQKALADQYQRFEDAAAEDGNQVLVDRFHQKVLLHQAAADALEARRAEWRKRHRLFPAILRGAREFGRAIANIVKFAGRLAYEKIKTQIEFYANEIKSFLANPLRYTADLVLTRKLEIIKNQLNDQLGPFFGQRVYDLIKIDQKAWQVEGRVFNRRKKPTATTAASTEAAQPVQESATGAANVVGDWHGETCDEAEGTYIYRWSVDLMNDPATDQVMGTVKFHACPGGGRVLYRVIGEPSTGAVLTLSGIKMDGGGDLFDNSADNVTFTLDTDTGEISPNLSQ